MLRKNMPSMPSTSFLRISLFFIIFFMLSLCSYKKVVAEQSGSSPESGSTSRLKTISDYLGTVLYGSTAAGSWGDWGLLWNRSYSAARTPANDFLVAGMKNGGGSSPIVGCTTGLSCYPQTVGGVDDYNNGGTTPADAYSKTWTSCSGPSYCGTGRSVAEKQDPVTGLVWSPRISSSSNWFVANNCKYPNGLANDSDGDNLCDSGDNGEPSCQCVKHTGGADPMTGCAVYDDGNWRLPYQKELMQSYIDGSWRNLTSAGTSYWSATTTSNATQYAWYTFQHNGNTGVNSKIGSTSVRCVR